MVNLALANSHFIDFRKVVKYKGLSGMRLEVHPMTFSLCVHPDLDATKTSKFITTNTVGKFPVSVHLHCYGMGFTNTTL